MTLKDTVKIAAVGDLHITKSAEGALSPMLTSVTEQADVLLLCGDLTDYGLPEEAKILAKELTTYVDIPIVAVLGNHDHESGLQGEVKNILNASGVKVLDGEATEVLGIGFAGTKGFCGGFSRWTLGSWGEELVKKFVHEAVEESLKLEAALVRLRTKHRIAVLHYSPIPGTVQGEPLEIYPFLGTSRLEEPLTRHPVTAVFHGHAHSGTLEGKTVTGTPVYNVAMPLLRKMFPNQPAYRLIEISVAEKIADGIPVVS
jgi:Icc-related predicted phosphoesterase